MKKILIVIFCFIGVSIYSNNKVSFRIENDKISASVLLNPSEFIILDSNTLFLNVDSEEYHFTFLGYPESLVDKNGTEYYSNELTLEGNIDLKDSVERGNYKIYVTYGFQTSDIEGNLNIPVEVTEEIIIKKQNNTVLSIKLIIEVIILIVVIMVYLYLRRKKIE